MNEDALAYQYTSLHIVTQSQAEAKTKKTASARQDHVEGEIKKMEQELLLYINEGYKESLRLTCWDYGGQAGFLEKVPSTSVYISYMYQGTDRWEFLAGHVLWPAPPLHWSQECVRAHVQHGVVSPWTLL